MPAYLQWTMLKGFNYQFHSPIPHPVNLLYIMPAVRRKRKGNTRKDKQATASILKGSQESEASVQS